MLEKGRRRTKVISILDPNQILFNIVRDAIDRHENRLFHDEKTVQGILRMLIKDIDKAVRAIRPEKRKDT